MNASKTDWYELKKEHGEWVLTVLCGGVGMFERKLTLSKEEEAYVHDHGEYYVEKLATDVSKTPEAFGPRLK
jgi:hypothetical protein